MEAANEAEMLRLEIERLSREIERTMYMVSHDLRKPVRHLVSLSQILLEDHLPDNVAAKEIGALIADAGARADSLLDAVLRYVKAGLVGTLGEVSLVAAWRMAVSGPGLEATAPAEAPAVLANAAALSEIFDILVGNAIKFAAAGREPRMSMATELNGDFVHVRVTDNGRGVPESEWDRVFDAFTRSGPQTDPGHGMGLAVARKLAISMGGALAIASSSPNGTTFDLMLPRIIECPDL